MINPEGVIQFVDAIPDVLESFEHGSFLGDAGVLCESKLPFGKDSAEIEVVVFIILPAEIRHKPNVFLLVFLNFVREVLSRSLGLESHGGIPSEKEAFPVAIKEFVRMHR